jgi:hypothetical protein
MIDFSFSVSSGCGVLIYSSSLFSVYKRVLLSLLRCSCYILWITCFFGCWWSLRCDFLKSLVCSRAENEFAFHAG